ncbi:MAG: hypothetical protein AAB740_03980, partial [Patescibacteria group bacterium]
MNKNIEKLKNLPFFKMAHLSAIFSHLKKPSLYQKITRFIGKGTIVQLKKGFFVSAEYVKFHISDYHYLTYLANILREPSYVSGVYALQVYGIFTEATYPITSITTKTSRIYSNKLGEFVYYSVSPKLFTGFKRDFFIGESVYIADREKALFDYLYIKYNKLSFSADNILERERFNIDDFSKKEISEFKRYCEISEKK